MFKHSAFRHNHGADNKREEWYLDISPSTYGDANPITVSRKFLAIAWGSTGGGQAAIIPISQVGKRDGQPAMVQGHSQKITTLDFDLFNDNRLATGSEDYTVKIWEIPDNVKDTVDAKLTLSGHTNKVIVVKFNPVANDILASGSTDKTVRVWDLSTGKEAFSVTLGGQVYDLAWNHNGTLLAVTTNDKQLSIVDIRAGSVTKSGECHQGVKPSLVTWAGESRIITTGFSKTRERQFALWDINNLSAPLTRPAVDSSTGVLLPFYDADAEQLYLTGKGDTSIRQFEVTAQAPYYFECEKVVSKTVQRGTAAVKKQALNVMDCEVFRFYRLGDGEVVPVSFIVPRKSKRDFAEDLFPLTAKDSPALSAAEWVKGATKNPEKMSLDPAKNGGATSAYSSSGFAAPVASTTSTSTSTGATKTTTSTSSAAGSGSPSTSTAYRSSFKQEEKPKEDEYYIPKKMNIVRASKYRHLGVKSAPQSQQFTNLKVKARGIDGGNLSASTKYFALPWQGSGGQLAVIPLSKPQKLPDKMGTLETGSEVCSFVFHPIKDDLLFVGLESNNIKIFKVPENLVTAYEGKNYKDFVGELKGHSRRVGELVFSPVCTEILASYGMDLEVKVWDLEKSAARISLAGHSDAVQSIAWNYNGSMLATSCKDMKARLWDPRSKTQPVMVTETHTAPKLSRVTFLGNTDYFFSVGFNKSSHREFFIYDIKNFSKPISVQDIDQGSGIFEPFYDEDINVMMLYAMGDSSVKYYEIESGTSVHYLTANSLGAPVGGIARLPKTSCDVRNVEIANFLKLSGDTVDRFAIFVPRTRKELFQDDIYTPTRTFETVVAAESWFAGKNGEPKVVDLRPSDMQPLGEAPKVERMVKKYNPDDVKMDAQDLKEAVVNRFYGQMMGFKEAEKQVLEQDAMEGVAEDEWD